MLRVALIGAHGRMGLAIQAESEAAEVDFVGLADSGDDLDSTLQRAAVVIDFSAPAAIAELAGLCAQRRLPLVTGTTGLSVKQQAAVLVAAETVPVVQAGNFSVGVNTLFWLVQKAARALGKDYAPEILELHHRHKQDAPSGTARDLASRIQAGVGEDWPLKTGRSGQSGARPEDEIGLHAIRGGEVIGEHTVFFMGPQDRIELSHRAADRGIFATGALRAARWALEAKPGMYNMQDVLGLTQP